jgi:hypothetical protein
MCISERTLRTKYLPELRHGLAQKRAEALVLLWKQVEKGNVSGIREFLKQIDKSDLVVPRAAVRTAKQVRLGKKDQAIMDAATPDLTTSMGELMARRAETAGKPH